jgi:general secretion pathway protein A
MYLNFYNMERAPFHITPDPDFLYLSWSHKEALGAMIYCIKQRKGFASVSGEVGTGKTTIIRSCLAKIDRNRVKPIYVFNPSVTFAELLKTIFQELGLKQHTNNVYSMVQQLHRALIKEYVQHRTIVLIIDEAQNMPVSTLEQLGILSNLETTKAKLLQIILVGQPELTEKLDKKELRQLNQRLAFKATLFPLSTKDSRNYILFRLSKVTASPQDVFSNGALTKIIKAAQGSPRMLNILCDNALIAGFAYKKKLVTGSIVKQVIADFEGKSCTPFLFSWKYASLFGIFLLSLGALSEMYAFLHLSQLSVGLNAQQSTSSKQTPVNTKAGIAKLPTSIQVATGPVKSLSSREVTVLVSHAPSSISREDSAPILPVTQDKNRHGKKVSLNMPPAPEEGQGDYVPPSSIAREIEVRSRARKVKRGEHLSQIIFDMYGFVNDQIIYAVKEKNPRIFDADLIFVGDTIFFPEFLKPKKRPTDFQGG